MKKLTRIGMLAGMLAFLISFAFTTTASAQRIVGGNAQSSTGQWVIMTYLPDNAYTVPLPQPVDRIRGGGVSFDFLSTPDRAMLLTDLGSPKTNLTGKILSAHIAIDATEGATFNYYNNDTGLADPGGFVRFYFNKVNTFGCPTGWHPSRPDCEAQYWWSDPVYIDLAALAAFGSNGTTLSVPLDPASWSDRDGHRATNTTSFVDTDSSDDSLAGAFTTFTHLEAFNAAVANVSKIGLSFGGNGWWAFGTGVNVPFDATFVLYKFAVKKP